MALDPLYTYTWKNKLEAKPLGLVTLKSCMPHCNF
jgi:hypothetical protein